MTLIRITAPPVEPVSLDVMKGHLRIEYTVEDSLIQQYISAARQKLEQRCARAFVQQTWELRIAEFEDSIEIPKPPTVSIDTVTYLDEDNVEQTVDSSEYALVGDGEGTSTLIRIGEWPTDLADRPDSVRIQFTAGWAPTGTVDPEEDPDTYVSNVPFDLRQAVMFLAAHLYENRESVAIVASRGYVMEVPDTVSGFIAPYIVPRL